MSRPVPLSVPTSQGQTNLDVIAAIAAAINAHPTLSAAGISAAVLANTVGTNGIFASVTLNDSGLSTALAIPSLPVWSRLLLVALLLLTVASLAAAAVRRRAES